MKPKIFMSYPPPSALAKGNFYEAAVTYCGGICCGGYLAEIRETVASEHDGLLLCGGPDAHPKYYGEEIAGTEEIDDARDVYEFALLEKFLQAGKPILGICRGHQMINLYFGGSLVQDLPTRSLHTDGNDIPHAVVSAGDSILSSLYGDRFVTNSSHHQGIKTPGDGLSITHYSEEDHVVEAIVHETLPILGVQWHPERMCLSKRRADTVDGLPLIQYFVDICRTK